MVSPFSEWDSPGIVFILVSLIPTYSHRLTAPTPLNPLETPSSTLRNMAEESPQADLVKHYRLETSFQEASVRHTICSPSTYKEEWRRAEEIGRGGFSVVYLEHGPESRVRAVKVIDKTAFSPGLDFTRELAIMSFLTKVCLSVCCSVE